MLTNQNCVICGESFVDPFSRSIKGAPACGSCSRFLYDSEDPRDEEVRDRVLRMRKEFEFWVVRRFGPKYPAELFGWTADNEPLVPNWIAATTEDVLSFCRFADAK